MCDVRVSTHSRPKAAEEFWRAGILFNGVSTHSRPKAAVVCSAFNSASSWVSTHSRPKAAVKKIPLKKWRRGFQHTAARRRLDVFAAVMDVSGLFQHTAARRRLL